MNIKDFINKYYNILIIGGVFSIMLLMGTFFFFLFRFIGSKNEKERKKMKEELHIDVGNIFNNNLLLN